MPQIGPMEILVVSVLALIVFGPNKLPDMARTAGAFLKQVRSMADDVKDEFKGGFDVDDEPDDDEVAGLDDEGVSQQSGARGPAGESPNGQRDLPADHPVAEAIKGEREPKQTGGES